MLGENISRTKLRDYDRDCKRGRDTKRKLKDSISVKQKAAQASRDKKHEDGKYERTNTYKVEQILIRNEYAA